MADLSLLGVGGGVIQPAWAGTHQQKHARTKEGQEREATPVTQTDTRDSRLLKEAAAEFNGKVVGYSQTVNLASINANTTANVTITVTTTDKVRAGDYVLYAGGASLEHGIVVQGGFPAPANDQIQLRLSNLTAASIDPVSQTMYFLVFRDVT